MNSRKIKIKDVCTINRATIDRKAPPESIYYLDTGSITRNIIDELKYLEKHKDKYPSRAQRLVKHTTIIYSTVRPNQEHFGIIKEPQENLIASTGFATLDITDSEIDPLYLYYSLTRKDITKHLQRIGEIGVTSYPSISPVDLGAVELQIPKKREAQSKIAKILSDLDAKIELNKKLNKELEDMAKLIYDYWFVQFDFPDEDGKPYKSSGGEMVFNEELNREIPERWEVKELGEYAEIEKGDLITAKTADSYGNIKVVSAGLDFSYYHSEANRKENTITISASGANAGFVNFWREPIFACDCTTVRGKSNAETLVLKEFLEMRQEFLFSQAKGSAQPHVYPKDIESLKIALPIDNLIKEFGKIVLNANKLISNNLQENKDLVELRDWLLPMLMNGQVTVAGAEQKISAAAEEKEESTKTQGATIIPFPLRRKINSEMKKVSGMSTIDTQVGSMCRIFVLYDNHDGPKEHFGRTKTEKANHVIESHAKIDMGRMPERMARGAADFQRLVNKVEYKAAKRGWFNATEINGVIHYRKGTRFIEPYQKLDQKLGVQKDEVDRIIKLFIPLTTHEAEVRQTVYAAWHDLIAYGQNPTDDQIVEWSSTEKYWAEEKEEIPKQEFFEAIQWLRENNLVPDGKGKLTMKQQK